jgi:hypothetical protein
MLSSVPATACNITKEELIAENINIFGNCPLCADFDVVCRVGSHPSVPLRAGKFTFKSHFSPAINFKYLFYILLNMLSLLLRVSNLFML